jgi:hypothetical protein
MLDRGRPSPAGARWPTRAIHPRRHPHLPFPDQSFPLVMAPYGILQSLLDETLLAATLKNVTAC